MARAPALYLDHGSTTPVDPRVLEEMIPCFSIHFGNPSSTIHEYGWYAAELVTIARERVAALIGGRPEEVIFTSGATESNNLALKGTIETLLRSGHSAPRIVSCRTEHRSVLDPLATLAARGCAITYVEVSDEGAIDLAQLRDALRAGASLVTFMAANNEVGTLHPLAEIARAAREAGALVHCDATQAVGKLPIDVALLGVDLLSLTAHKLGGPKGAGALWIRGAVGAAALAALAEGGGQESGLRSGTLNVPGIVGLGKAAELARTELPERRAHLEKLARRFLEVIGASGLRFELNGPLRERLPGNLNLSFAGVESAKLLTALQGKVAFSVSSACQSAASSPPHVLAALGLPEERQRAAFRLGFGMTGTEAEAEQAAGLFVTAVRTLIGKTS